MSLIQYITRIQFETGALALLPEEIDRLALRQPLLITDKGVVAAGILNRVLEAAKPHPLTVYADTTANPTEACLEHCLDLWRTSKCDGVIAVGGGSAIDLAKAVALLTSHGGRFGDYGIKSGGSAAIGVVSPHIAIPTAAGTGAEIGRACVMTLHGGQKCVAVNLNMVANCVIADPELTASLPPVLTAATGVDALSHGIEAFLSPAFNPPADAVALDCVQRVATWLPRAVENGIDPRARQEMMMAALEGGMVLQKGLGAAHAMANPLGEANHHHGTLIGILLPAALAFNADAAPQKMEQLATAVQSQPGQPVADWVAAFVQKLGLPGRLRSLGINADDIAALAPRAAVDHLSVTNPRPATSDDYLHMLSSVL